MTKKEKKEQIENYLKGLRSQRNVARKKEIKRKFSKPKAVYREGGGFYPKGTNMRELSRNFVLEYKEMVERKKAVKMNTMTGEQFLRAGYNKNKRYEN